MPPMPDAVRPPEPYGPTTATVLAVMLTESMTDGEGRSRVLSGS
jgi:hypothetical protein